MLSIFILMNDIIAKKEEVVAREAWNSFVTIIGFLTTLLTISTQMALIVELSWSTGGPFFLIICVIKPIFNIFLSRVLWDKGTFSVTVLLFSITKLKVHYMTCSVCFGYVYNKDRTRMDALRDLTQLQYRQDLISNNLGEWILNGPSHPHSTL